MTKERDDADQILKDMNKGQTLKLEKPQEKPQEKATIDKRVSMLEDELVRLKTGFMNLCKISNS